MTNISISKTTSSNRNSPMLIETKLEVEQERCSKFSHIISIYGRNYEVVKDNKMTGECLIGFCLFAKHNLISYVGSTSDES